ncbi:MAG: acetyltransferase [Saprospiraceae bacterium]|nr:acetyltransferase [Saprospiraceae bacterium]
MLVIGAKGFAKEVLEVIRENGDSDNLTFYDDINSHDDNLIFAKFPIITNEEMASDYFKKHDNRFTIGIGNPILRSEMEKKFNKLGGKLSSVISTHTEIGTYEVRIDDGTIVMPNAIISNSVSIGKGSIIYFQTTITHDVSIGRFVEVSPGAVILGRSQVGDFSQIGANATILPDVKVGMNVIVAAGAVVTQNVPDNCMVAGIPAAIKKEISPLNFLHEK